MDQGELVGSEGLFNVIPYKLWFKAQLYSFRHLLSDNLACEFSCITLGEEQAMFILARASARTTEPAY